MARKVAGRTGDLGIPLPYGWVIDGDDEVVVSDGEWEAIEADLTVLNRLDDLGVVSDGLISDPPTWRDIQQNAAHPGGGGGGGDVTQAEFDAHLADTTSVHGIADTSLLETKTGAQAKVNAHANLTNNPHSVTKAQVGLGDVANLAPEDLPISDATSDALGLKADLVGGEVPLSQLPDGFGGVDGHFLEDPDDPGTFIPGDGGGGGDSNFFMEQNFAVANDTWSVNHAQGTYGVSVVTLTPGDTPLIGEVTYPDDDHVVVLFETPQTGKARVFN